VDKLMESFLQDCKTRGMSPRSLPGYKSALKMYGLHLQSRGLDILQADRDSLRGFIEYMRDDRQVSQQTLKTTFSVLSSFYDYLVYENRITSNPVLPVRKRYLKRYKDNRDGQNERQIVSVDDMAAIINSTLNIRDKALIALLAKTGIRRHELAELDASDVDLVENSIRLKPTNKRSNRTVFFDDECSYLLRRWLRIREGMNRSDNNALFINQCGSRINRNGIYQVVTEAAGRVGLHHPESERLEDHFGPHCCRHWFCTHLFRAGMRREYIKELRGDSRKEAFDLYNHIDMKELKEAYLAAIPQLGI
jgi:integrase/recombinase XerD